MLLRDCGTIKRLGDCGVVGLWDCKVQSCGIVGLRGCMIEIICD